MKTPFIISSLIAMAAAANCLAEEDGDARKDEKVHYALILPEEKAPELVKQNEACPFGGLIDDKAKETVSGEEAKVGDMLRSLPVRGKSSRNIVLLGDIILRRGQLVPAIIPNQTVQLMVRDITPERVELVWVEKKPTGLNPRVLTIDTDVTPQVSQRLPGNLGGKGGAGESAPMTITRPRSEGSAEVKTAETPPAATEPAGPAGKKIESSPPPAAKSSMGDSLLNMFFGKSQVKDEAKPGAPKTEKEDEDKPDHEAKP